MDNFYKAIYAKIAGSDFATAIGSRFSYGEAKGVYPNASYFGLPSTNEDTFTETIDGMSVQINIYSDKSSSIEVTQTMKKCRACFDGKIITSTGNHPAKLYREMETPPWKNGDIWVASIEFLTLLMKE